MLFKKEKEKKGIAIAATASSATLPPLLPISFTTASLHRRWCNLILPPELPFFTTTISFFHYVATPHILQLLAKRTISYMKSRIYPPRTLCKSWIIVLRILHFGLWWIRLFFLSGFVKLVFRGGDDVFKWWWW